MEVSYYADDGLDWLDENNRNNPPTWHRHGNCNWFIQIEYSTCINMECSKYIKTYRHRIGGPAMTLYNSDKHVFIVEDNIIIEDLYPSKANMWCGERLSYLEPYLPVYNHIKNNWFKSRPILVIIGQYLFFIKLKLRII